jgi:hypothetical protein
MAENSVICGKGNFIIVFRKVSRWCFSEPWRTQSDILTVLLHNLPTLVSHIYDSKLMASCLRVSTKLLYALLISPVRVTCPSHLILLSWSTYKLSSPFNAVPILLLFHLPLSNLWNNLKNIRTHSPLSLRGVYAARSQWKEGFCK